MIGKTISHYRIIDKLGEGGMGVVYRAEDTRLDRVVALKFLSPRIIGDAADRERFIREAKSAAALNHPNICTVHAIDEFEGDIFIAMEYVEGDDLRVRLRAGPLELDDALSIAAQVADGLACAHRREIIHRDIKPANIMVTSGGLAKIMDFGLARGAGGAQLTVAGTTVGTVAYMSPEQAGGGEVDEGTDLWSLGVVLHEMLTGERPFRGAGDQAIIYSIMNSEPRPASELRAELAADVDSLLRTLLTKRPAAARGKAAQMAADMKRLAAASDARTMTISSSDSKPSASIAVMPFADMSPEGDQEYFCDGMSEEIINELTGVSGLRVIARTSAFAFKGKDEDIREIGRKLDVISILEGSVRKAGERVRITAQLINVSDGSHAWSERYDRVLEDIFSVQDEIATAIVEKLKVELTDVEQDRLAEERKVDQRVHELYLRGRHMLNRGLITLLHDLPRVDKAIEFFTEATEIDPDYAPPYALLADTYSALCRWISPEGNCEKARFYASKALELDDESVEAHVAMGRVLLTTEFDWDGARAEHVRSLEINPGSADAQRGAALYHGWAGEFKQAMIHAAKAMELDPLNYDSHLVAVFITLVSRSDPMRSMATAKAAQELFPGDSIFEGNLIHARIEAGIDVEKSVDELVRRWPSHEATGVICAMAGRTEEAREVIARLDEKKSEDVLYAKARIYAALGEKDMALDLLERIWEETPRILLQLNSDSELDVLRGEQRFKDLIARSGIPVGELAHLSE